MQSRPTQIVIPDDDPGTLVEGMDLKLLHPALAHERACDLGEGFSEQRIGEPSRDGFVVRVEVSPEEHVAANVRRAWWVAHYAGIPTRSRARGLALVRAAAFHPQEVVLAFLRRELTSGKERSGGRL